MTEVFARAEAWQKAALGRVTGTIAGVGALLGLEWWLLGRALSFPPTDRDDLKLLSVVADAPSPWRFLAGDWGMGNFAFRPLHSMILWATYRLVGVVNSYHQAINLVIHGAICCLLFVVLCRLPVARVGAWLSACLVLISPYTVSAATWVSDRPTLLVALCLVLALAVILETAPGRVSERVAVVSLMLLSIVALLSKESGIVLPVTVAYWAWARTPHLESRRAVITGCVALTAMYLVMRAWLFGPDAVAYGESGALLGLTPYRNWHELGGLSKSVAVLDNVVKNGVATVVPVFGNDGAWLPLDRILRMSVVWCAWLGVAVLGWSRAPTPAQRLGMAIVAANAVIHFALFRFRVLYLGEIGVALYLAGAFQPMQSRARRWAMLTMAALILLANGHMVSRDVEAGLQSRRDRLASGDWYHDRDASSSVSGQVLAAYSSR